MTTLEELSPPRVSDVALSRSYFAGTHRPPPDGFPATFPSGQGSDLAGVVAGVGDGGPDFAVGDEVLGFSWQRSSQATHVAVPVTQLIGKPPELTWPVAGGLYVVACTGYAAVHAVAAAPDETVAVSAAAGGVGTVVVQLLRAHGVHVLGIASAANDAWLTAHGATAVPYGDGLADRPAPTVTGTPPPAAASSNIPGPCSRWPSPGYCLLPVAATYPLEKVVEAFETLERRHPRGKIVLLP